MELGDFLEPQVAAAAAVAAIIASPRVRGWLRQGAVYGLAGALVAGEAMGSFARGVAGGVQQAAASAADAAQRASTAARATSQNGQGAAAAGGAGASEGEGS